ncbi:penicillin-binding protein activator [Alsobacter sp. R-9]
MLESAGPVPSLLARWRPVAVAAAAALGLAACTTAGLPGLGGSEQAPSGSAEVPVIPGKVRVGLILPLSAAGSLGAAGNSLKNAAEMAVAEYPGSKVQLIVKDDRAEAGAAREAAQQALGEGVEIILGPLTAPSVQAVGQVTRGANRPVIAFSTDATVASRGVYLLSFMPESEVDRIVEFAASRGKRSIAAMIPTTAYGNVVAAAFQEAASRRGLQVPALERYDRNGIDSAAKRIAALGAGADALFVPDNAEGLAAVTPLLASNGVRLQLLGTSAWDGAFANRGLQGGWYAAPDKAGFNSFAARYRARFGSEPARVASLAYDAVFLVEALYAKSGSAGFSDATLTNPEGIIGTDGLFRFRPDGTNQRGLAVLQVGAGSATVVSPAPRSFAGGDGT